MPQKPALRKTASALNSSVKLISADATSAEQGSSKPNVTSLRRATRSTTTRNESPPPLKTSKLNISKYEYTPSTPSPRKKPRLDDGVKKEDNKPVTPKSAKKSIPQASLAKSHPAPAKWEEQYRLIEQMRRGIIAPVDDMGCERPRTNTDGDPKTFRFHILISLMLSSQTKDAVTSAAVTLLHATLPGGLNAESLAAAPADVVQECINKVGFWRRKAEYIQAAAAHLLKREGDEKGDVPRTLEGLCELKGVGPKMAFLALQCAWDVNAGIGVDVHVHRITNRLKWHRPPTTTPEQTRLNLQSWLPTHLHKPINPLFVGFGQVVCVPVGPRCDICLLGQKKVCPSRVTGASGKGRKEIMFSFNGEEDGLAVGTWIWGQSSQDHGTNVEPKVKVDYEGLSVIEDEPDAVVKRERGDHIEKVVEKPGMKTTEEVLEVLDQVDGPVDIGDKSVVKEERTDW